MTRSIFINLPVQNLSVSRQFYVGLGFTINETFSDDTAACVVVSDTIHVMLMIHARWAEFSETLPPGDPRTTCPHILALSCEDRGGVDAMFDAAMAHGGRAFRPTQDMGFMYLRAIADPDGHVWEPFWMDPNAAADGPPED